MLIRRFLAPALGLDSTRLDSTRLDSTRLGSTRLDSKTVEVLNPYWGDDAARFRWQGASLATEAEKFGGQPVEILLAEAAVQTSEDHVPADRTLVSIARISPDDAIDLLWSASVESADVADFEGLSDWAELATKWSSVDLNAVADDVALLDVVPRPVAAAPKIEKFGGRTSADLLREGLSRLQSSGSRLLSRTGASLLRRRVQQEGATFMGEVLAYLRQREEHGPNAPIAAKVAAALEEANSGRTAKDPVVVIAHSMGRNVAFDVLSNLFPELHCDVLITVGSQVGLFAEFGLLPTVTEPATGATGSGYRSPRPANIGRWINVFDECDVLSFATEGNFTGTEDFKYSTGRGVIRSHSGYFLRPSFFRRLAERLASGPR